MGYIETTRGLRRQNRAEVLRSILINGEATRSSIARSSSLSPATVGSVVADLIAEGTVAEVGRLPSGGGRPTIRLQAVAESAYFLGADVGERGVQLELFDLQMTLVDHETFAFGDGRIDPEAVNAALGSAAEALLGRCRRAGITPIGAGLGLPGVVETEPDGRVRVFGQSMGWGGIDLGDLTRTLSVPVFAENGATTLAMAERWIGSARDLDHAVVVLIGRGLGAAILDDGRILHGPHSSAGEWGHMKVERGGRQCRCGARGCLEAYVGQRAVLERWREHGGGAEVAEPDAYRCVADAADSGDDVAQNVLHEALDYLGLGLANLVNILSPSRIILGGQAGAPLIERYRNELSSSVIANSLDRLGRQMQLVPGRAPSNGVALGAALLPLQELVLDRTHMP